MKRLLFCTVLLILLLQPGAASDIREERMHIQLDAQQPANVTVERHYEQVSPSQISYLVSARYNPTGLTARDDQGELDCTVRTFDFGSEIVCDPREREDYTVEIQFFGEFVERDRQGYRFSYMKQVLTPTDQTALTVTLPEGYGLVSSDTPYMPEGAEVGSEGRRIFLDWHHDNVSTGDTIQYSVEYEELQVFDRIPFFGMMGILLVIVFSAGAAAMYVRGRGNGENTETIASIFPVLKDDEQLVLRYIIEQDGEVEQRDIVDNVDYSKAKISKLLSDLAERNLIDKEKQGRVNVIKLSREVGEIGPKAEAPTADT